MSEPRNSSEVDLCRLTPEQMAIIQGKERQFLEIFKQQLAEQAKTNELLALLIQALAEDQCFDPDVQPMSYLSGAPVVGGL